MTTSAAVATTDKRQAHIDGQLGRDDHQHQHGGRQSRNRLPAPRRQHRQQRDRAHHRRAQHAGRGLHHDDEQHQREAASPTAARGPISRDENSTAPQTIVTLAPDTAVRCVRPAVRNSWLVIGVTVDVSPRTSAGSIAAWSAGSTSTSRGGEPGAHGVRGPVHRPGATHRRRTDRVDHRHRQVMAGGRGDAGAERAPAGRPSPRRSRAPARKPLPGRMSRRCPSRRSVARNISWPWPTDTRAFGGRDGHLSGGAECRGDRVVSDCVGAQRDREPEARADDAGGDQRRCRSPASGACGVRRATAAPPRHARRRSTATRRRARSAR